MKYLIIYSAEDSAGIGDSMVVELSDPIHINSQTDEFGNTWVTDTSGIQHFYLTSFNMDELNQIVEEHHE